MSNKKWAIAWFVFVSSALVFVGVAGPLWINNRAAKRAIISEPSGEEDAGKIPLIFVNPPHRELKKVGDLAPGESGWFSDGSLQFDRQRYCWMYSEILTRHSRTLISNAWVTHTISGWTVVVFNPEVYELSDFSERNHILVHRILFRPGRR